MSMSSAPSRAAAAEAFYAAFLENLRTDLTLNSKPVITSLTQIAGENKPFARAIVDALRDHILECRKQHKLCALYLCDSIVKNVGEPFVELFARDLPAMYINVWERCPEARNSLGRLLDTWQGAANSPSVFPPKMIEHIHQQVSERLERSTASLNSDPRRMDGNAPPPRHRMDSDRMDGGGGVTHVGRPPSRISDAPPQQQQQQPPMMDGPLGGGAMPMGGGSNGGRALPPFLMDGSGGRSRDPRIRMDGGVQEAAGGREGGFRDDPAWGAGGGGRRDFGPRDPQQQQQQFPGNEGGGMIMRGGGPGGQPMHHQGVPTGPPGPPEFLQQQQQQHPPGPPGMMPQQQMGPPGMMPGGPMPGGPQHPPGPMMQPPHHEQMPPPPHLQQQQQPPPMPGRMPPSSVGMMMGPGGGFPPMPTDPRGPPQPQQQQQQGPPPAAGGTASLLSSLLSSGLISLPGAGGGSSSAAPAPGGSPVPPSLQLAPGNPRPLSPQPGGFGVSHQQQQQQHLPGRPTSFGDPSFQDLSPASVAALLGSSERLRPKHLDYKFQRKKRLRSGHSASRAWFVSADMWVAGTGPGQSDAAPSAFFNSEDPEESQALPEVISVAADESQTICAISGEKFEEFFDEGLQEWRYRDARKLTGAEAAKYGVGDGAIVLVSCLSTAMPVLDALLPKPDDGNIVIAHDDDEGGGGSEHPGNGDSGGDPVVKKPRLE